MSTKNKNYKKELKSALSSLIDLDGSFGMHWTLATDGYKSTDDITDKVLVDIIDNYLTIKDMDTHSDLKSIEDFENEFNDEEDEF